MPPAIDVRLSLLVRTIGSLAIVSIVTITIALVAAAVTSVTAFLAIGAVSLLAGQYFGPLLGWSSVTSGGFVSARTLAALALVIGVLTLPVVYLRPVREQVRAFQTELGRTGQPATERHPEIASMVRRLAHQADIPEPDVRIVDRRRPESYALGGRSDGTIILTRGLVRRLTDDELEAVLAHEVSHLVNGDSRLMTRLVVPLLLAERVGSGDRPTFRLRNGFGVFEYAFRLLAWAVVTLVTTVQVHVCHLGVALLSRGRELAADRGAAELTGSPAALASALETLHDDRGRPSEDLRRFERSVAALDILPTDDLRERPGPFRTHPPIETRVERLRALDADGSA